MKKSKLIIIAAIVIVIFIIKMSCTSEKTPENKVVTVEDPIQKAKELKIEELNTALYLLENRIKKNMKDPDSYDLMHKAWDPKDTSTIVKMQVKFRGDNSFGGKTITTVFATYNRKTRETIITDQVND